MSENTHAFLADVGIDAEAIRNAKVVPGRFVVDEAASISIGGMFARDRITKGDTVLQLPYHCFLNAHHALVELGGAFEAAVLRIEANATPIAAELAASKPSATNRGCVSNEKLSTVLPHNSALLDAEFVIATFLIKERFGGGGRGVGDGTWGPSRFSGYVASLPGVADMSTPEFCVDSSATSVDDLPPEVLAAYGSRMRAQKAVRRRQKLQRKFELWRAAYFGRDAGVFPPDAFTFEHWMWAIAIMASRSFSYRSPADCDYPWKWRQIVAAARRARGEDSNDDDVEDDEEEDDEDEEEEEENDDDEDEEEVAEVDPRTGLLAGIVETAEEIAARRAAAKDRRRGPGLIGQQMSADESGTDSEADDSDDADDEPPEDESTERKRGHETFTLIPFADMFNHSATASHNFSFDKRSKTFVIKMDRSYESGDQVFIRYNSMDHWRFAKYYGFVPQHDEGGGAGPFDSFPIVVPPPPAAFADSGKATVVDITKHQLFEGGSLTKHCCVTAKGPNRKLIAALRLRYLTEAEFGSYTDAFGKDPLSVRNEWHAYRALLTTIRAAIQEIVSNANAVDGSGLDARLRQVAVPVRERDLLVLRGAEAKAAEVYRGLSEVLYYGSSVQDIIRTNVIHRQFRQLQALGRLPATVDEQMRVGLGLLPRITANALADASLRGSGRAGGGVRVDANDITEIVSALDARFRSGRKLAGEAAIAAAPRNL